MNWKLVMQLSMFGLVMGIATVFVIPPAVEPLVWLAIFITCAVLIARRTTEKRFLHGLSVSVVNSVWITAEVDDVDKTVKAVEKAGGMLMRPKAEIPDMGWVAYCVDPEGNVFGLHQMAKKK